MQYRVPQNVDMEDKVVGPLTFRQFIIILITVGIIIALFFIIPSVLRFFFFLLAAIIAFLGGAIGFVKYGDQNMENFMLSSFATFQKPRQRVWKKAPEPVQTMTTDEAAPIQITRSKRPLSEEKGDLSRLARVMDSSGHVKINKKDQVIGDISTNSVIETAEVKDTIENSEANDRGLEGIIKNAEKKTPNREALVSEVAKLNPDKQFNYPNIKIKEEGLVKASEKSVTYQGPATAPVSK